MQTFQFNSQQPEALSLLIFETEENQILLPNDPVTTHSNEVFNTVTVKTERTTESAASFQPDIRYKVVHPEEVGLQKLKRGRPKKKKVDPIRMEETEEEEAYKPVKGFRTRSGRITRIPKHIEKNFDVPEPDASLPSNSNVPATTTQHLLPGIQQKKRNISPQFRCPTCKKAYLGQKRMLHHFKTHPEHGPVPEICLSKFLSLWDTAIRRTKKFPEGYQALHLCNQLTDLIEKARNLIPLLLKPPSEGSMIYQVNEVLSSCLNIPSGSYSLSDEAIINATLKKQPESLNNGGVPQELILPRLDLDSSQDNSLALDSSIESDAVMSVDQLVNERLKTLTDAELAPPTLDLSLDLFSFHTS